MLVIRRAGNYYALFEWRVQIKIAEGPGHWWPVLEAVHRMAEGMIAPSSLLAWGPHLVLTLPAVPGHSPGP
jgi:hypothetical protein